MMKLMLTFVFAFLAATTVVTGSDDCNLQQVLQMTQSPNPPTANRTYKHIYIHKQISSKHCCILSLVFLIQTYLVALVYYSVGWINQYSRVLLKVKEDLNLWKEKGDLNLGKEKGDLIPPVTIPLAPEQQQSMCAKALQISRLFCVILSQSRFKVPCPQTWLLVLADKWPVTRAIEQQRNCNGNIFVLLCYKEWALKLIFSCTFGNSSMLQCRDNCFSEFKAIQQASMVHANIHCAHHSILRGTCKHSLCTP